MGFFTRKPKEELGSIDRCLRCGQKFKIGDFVLPKAMRAIELTAERDDGFLGSRYEDIIAVMRAEHEVCVVKCSHPANEICELCEVAA